MIRRSFAMFTALSLAALAPAGSAVAQTRDPSSEYPRDTDRYSAEQLDNLVGPIALYPDALLAQVLVAATFPDQIDDAARFVRANGTSDIDDQSWDVSVKAVAHYPSALNMMADKPDWTTTLGRAYATQSSDVMAAVQRMRRMADDQGNLRSTPQQQVQRDADNYVIVPAQERVIYVPVYDPYVIYTRPIFGLSYYSNYWSFGIGFPIGGWLSYDCNWRTRAVYYNGWDSGYYGYSGGYWRQRARPYIHITNVYVNDRYRNVYINRDVIRRSVEYRNVDRYPGVHRDTRFGGRDVDYRGGRDRVSNVPDRSRYDDSRRGGTYNSDPRRGGTYGNDSRSTGNLGRTDDRGTWNRSDDRGNGNRGDDRQSRGTVPGTYTPPDRSRDQGQGGTAYPSQTPNQGRDNRSNSSPTPDRGGWNRDVNNNSTWGRDRETSRATPVPDQPRRGQRPEMGSPRDDWRGRDRGAPPEVRAPVPRNDQPMINPRRAEPQPSRQAPSGNGGQRGGPRGGGERGGRERPIF